MTDNYIARAELLAARVVAGEPKLQPGDVEYRMIHDATVISMRDPMLPDWENMTGITKLICAPESPFLPPDTDGTLAWQYPKTINVRFCETSSWRYNDTEHRGIGVQNLNGSSALVLLTTTHAFVSSCPPGQANADGVLLVTAARVFKDSVKAICDLAALAEPISVYHPSFFIITPMDGKDYILDQEIKATYVKLLGRGWETRLYGYDLNVPMANRWVHVSSRMLAINCAEGVEIQTREIKFTEKTDNGTGIGAKIHTYLPPIVRYTVQP